MAQGLVLDPTSGLINSLIGEFDDVELVRHLSGLRQAVVEDGLVGTGEIKGAPRDVLPPLLALTQQPALGLVAASARHQVQELSSGDVDD